MFINYKLNQINVGGSGIEEGPGGHELLNGR
jgi:hypothetical protein